MLLYVLHGICTCLGHLSVRIGGSSQRTEEIADLPTDPYLTVLVRKSAGCTDVRLYFSKYGHRVSRKYGNGDVNECKFVSNKADRKSLMGSYRSLI